MLIATSLSQQLLNELHKLPPLAVYGLVFSLVFSEAALFVGFILPGEAAALVGGAVASQGRVSIVTLCVLVVAAAIMGDSVGYFVGSRWGDKLLTLPLVRTRQGAIHRALAGLRRRGPIYVFLGRFSAFLRAVMPGLAGMSKMHYRRFLVANAAGGLLWGLGFTLLGYYAGKALGQIQRDASWAAGILLGVVLAAVVGRHFYVKRREGRVEIEWAREQPDERAP